jgi:phosphoribosylformylglycinamidine synthase PurS subunit
MKAKIHVTLKNGVLDPQGKAIESALDHMGFRDVAAARVGKYIELDLKDTSADKAKAAVKEMCEKLLANTVIEKYSVELAEQ